MSRQDADVSPVGRLMDIRSGSLGDLAVRHLRVRPRQARSIESVERILASAIAMMLGHRGMEAFSIEKISAGAGVTPQAAYRYFKDADELIGTALRCVVIREYERLIARLSEFVLLNGADMARAVVGLVLDSRERLSRYPVHLQADLMREYRQVGSDASLLISELICKPVGNGDARHSLDIVKVSVALTATIAVATSPSLKARPAQIGHLDGMLATLFTGVLQSDGSSFDAFREMGIGFSACWDDVG